MAETHHHHHRHRKDSSSRFKERSLRWIRVRKLIEKWLKIVLIVVAVIMMIAVFLLYYVL